MHVNDQQALTLFEQEKFGIIRKPPETMLKVRRLVFDNEFQPKDLSGLLKSRWEGEGWTAAGAGFKSPAGDEGAALRYHHCLRSYEEKHDAVTGKAPARSLITDYMGYNSYQPHGGVLGENWVTDLMIETEVQIDKPAGELVLDLGKSKNRFRLHWNLANGDLDLYQVRGVKGDDEIKETKLATKKVAAPKAGSTYTLRFADFDDRLTV